jgi:HAMP domain-containing protein
MSDKNRSDSPIVTSVLRLENHLSELERVGGKITAMDMTADIDVEHIQKLLTLFTDCGGEISEEVKNLSAHLQQAQIRAEAVAREVSRQANAFNARRNEQNAHLERLRLLGEKVHELNATLTGDDQSDLAPRLPIIADQLSVMIVELQELRSAARSSRMRSLERTAEALAQSLQALQVKLHNLS